MRARYPHARNTRLHETVNLCFDAVHCCLLDFAFLEQFFFLSEELLVCLIKSVFGNESNSVIVTAGWLDFRAFGVRQARN